MNYFQMTKDALAAEQTKLFGCYNKILEKKLSLDMSRGKPEKQQLEITQDMLSVISSNADCYAQDGTDCRNYGIVDGIPEAKKLFADLLEVAPENVIVGGNSSLNLMYDQMVRCLIYGVSKNDTPWSRNENNIFLCPVPGYDRHFCICETLGIKMINVPMTSEGPDMDVVEEYIKNPDVKGIWCVPKYSNPDGVVYSDKVVKRLASMKPAASDFRIFWDNAYCIHDLYNETVPLLNIIDECAKAGNPDMVYEFTSTSKVTYPGAGVSVIASSKNNIDYIRSIMQFQTIGHDKLNMLRHVKYFGDAQGMKAYMKKHADILRPKFEAVIDILTRELSDCGVATWSNPKGGYFVSLDVMDGCAKKTVELCAKAGVKLTGAGATFPYGIDPCDKNIRIAPSFPAVSELLSAMEVLCVCVKLACIDKLLNK